MAEAEGHVTAQAEGHDVPPEEDAKPDLVDAAGFARFGHAGIGIVEHTAAIRAHEDATCAHGLLAFAAVLAIADHRWKASRSFRTNR
jgi:hypothetical protein